MPRHNRPVLSLAFPHLLGPAWQAHAFPVWAWACRAAVLCCWKWLGLESELHFWRCPASHRLQVGRLVDGEGAGNVAQEGSSATSVWDSVLLLLSAVTLT